MKLGPVKIAPSSRSKRVPPVVAATAAAATATIKNKKPTPLASSTQIQSNKESVAEHPMILFQSSSSSSTYENSIESLGSKKYESATATQIVNNSDSMEHFPPPPPAPSTKIKSTTTTTREPLAAIAIPNEKESVAVGKVAPPPIVAAARASKRIGKILETMDVKILENVKPDNKQKHTKSTSTPSGLRRKPLSAPCDVSLIVASSSPSTAGC